MGIRKYETGAWAILGAVIALAVLFGSAGMRSAAASSPEQGSPWKRYQLTGSYLLGVDAVSANDAWAVGTDGMLAHWDGSAWRAYDSKLGTSGVQAVDMLSSNQGWATSSGGRMLRFDGSNWTLDAGNVSATMYGVSMVSPTDGWAAGSLGTLAHYNGSSWQQVAPAGTLTATLYGIDMVSATDGWAVGGVSTPNGMVTKIGRYNGTGWQEFPSPVTNRIFYGVAMLDATYGWAVGIGGTLMQWDGTNWNLIPPPISCQLSCGAANMESVSVTSRNDAWAVGATNISVSNVWHWNGTVWTEVTTPNGAPMSGIAMLSASDGWVVGDRGTIFRYNGSTWNVANTHWTTNGYYGVDFLNPNDGWAVGVLNQSPPAYGLQHWDGTSWTSYQPPFFQPTMYDVGMVSTDAVWAVGTSGYVFKWNGTAWSRDTSPSDAHLYAMSMVSSTLGWAVGSSGRMVRYDGTAWTNYTSTTTTNLWSIDMANENEGWAGGTLGLMLHYQNGTWTALSPNPANFTIEGIHMLNANEGWAVGYSGTIIHYLNGTWTSQPSQVTTNLLNVHMLNSNEGWAVGASGTILHYLNGTWTPVTSPTGIPVRDVYMLDANHGWAVGEASGPILRYDVQGGTTPTPTSVPSTPTNTPVSSTATRTPTVPTATPTLCPISFTDVHPSDYFYNAVRYLYCRNVISGYGSEFRPYTNTYRGQVCKIVVLSLNMPINTTGGPHFIDVPTTHVYYPYVETLWNTKVITGYGDEFRPYDYTTRGQFCKILVRQIGWERLNPTTPTFTDVPVGSTFFTYVETAYCHGIISGYGSLFKPNDPATRGQISKIVYEALVGGRACP